MKKTFRTILAGAVALLAVSCYDDSALREEIAGLDERVDAIEATLNAEVNGIDDLISRIETLEGKIAAIKVETEDGVTTLTLSDGREVVLSKNGALTIVDGGWATVATDGTVTPLNIKVGHPDLTFKVENNELKYSVDGTSFVATGVKISDYTAHVIGNVVPAKDGKSVTVTIGDQTLELPLVTSAVASLGLSRDSFFLRYSAEKVVEITANGLTDVYVMNEPDGWKASIDGDKLTIVSPSKKAIAADAAEAEGLVLVHAVSDEGKCIVAKLEVSTGKGLTIECDEEGMLTIRNAYTSMQSSGEEGISTFGFTNFYIGIVSAEDYYNNIPTYMQMSFEDYWLSSGEPWGYGCYYYNNRTPGEYVEGENETDVINVSINELFSTDFGMYMDLPFGPWVIFAASIDEKGLPTDGVEVLDYLNIQLEVSVAETSHNEVKIKVKAQGADSYLIGGVEQSYYSSMYSSLDDYMTDPNMMSMGPWSVFIQYGSPMQLGNEVYYIEEEEFEISPYIPCLRGDKMKFDSTYDIWVMPMFNFLVKYDDYGDPDYSAYNYNTHFKPYVLTVKTNPVAAGDLDDSLMPAVEKSCSYTKVEASISPVAGTTVYYAFVTSEELLELDSVDKQFDYLVENCYYPITEKDSCDKDLKPGESAVLLYAVLSSEGKYETQNTVLEALALPTEKSEDLAVTLEENVTMSSISVKLTPGESVTSYYYNYFTAESLALYTDDAALMTYMFAYSSSNASSTTAVKNYLMPGEKWTLVVIAVGENGAYNIISKEYTTEPIAYNDDIKVTPASVSISGTTATVTVNVEGGATKVAFKAASPGTDYAKLSTEKYAYEQDSYGNVSWADVNVDGTATVTIRYVNAKYTFYAVGCKVDEGVVSIGHAAEFIGEDYITK